LCQYICPWFGIWSPGGRPCVGNLTNYQPRYKHNGLWAGPRMKLVLSVLLLKCAIVYDS
jgi:hypothetical protein